MKGFLGWLEGFGVNTAFVLAGAGVLMFLVAVSVIDIPTSRWVGFIFVTSPLWLPWLLFFVFFHYWLEYVQLDWNIAQGRTTLEIQFPQEVMKSPLAMELVLQQLYQTASPDNHFQTYWDGKNPPVYGLEIVSTGGKIHFYVNTPIKKFKNMWETQFYAQYPGIIVRELPIDYTAEIPWDPKRYGYFSLHFGLKKPDPYPIKTYVDFGLDKDPKEEFKIDPITSMLEFMGSIGPKEHVWVQILISAHRDVNFKVGSLHAHEDWKHEVAEEIEKIMKKRSGKGEEDDKGEKAGPLTPKERDTIAALERSVSKTPFNAKIRCTYIGELDVPGGFLPGERIGAIITMWRAFDDITRNAIGFAWRTDYDWNMWQDPTGKKRLAHKKREFHHHKLRAYEQQGAKDKPFILTTEELATIFHPVGQVALTPTLERVPSARAEAPANLPRGEGI
jgi:hypothetical protein